MAARRARKFSGITATARAPVAVLALLSQVHAGPPLVSDDPETPGRGGWEINISHNIERTQDELMMFNPLVDINYGWLENDQWKIEFPVVFADPDAAGPRWGAGDIEVGWKYRFRDEDAGGSMASIYPQLLIPTADAGEVLPGGLEETALGKGDVELFLPVEVGRHYGDGKLLVYAELGYRIRRAQFPRSAQRCPRAFDVCRVSIHHERWQLVRHFQPLL